MLISVHVTHASEAYFHVRPTTVACVNPHAHIFLVMQVTAGMHNIRALKAEKQQNANIRQGGGGQSRSGCMNRQTVLSITGGKKTTEKGGS